VNFDFLTQGPQRARRIFDNIFLMFLKAGLDVIASEAKQSPSRWDKFVA
jgi:hypothetical protein